LEVNPEDLQLGAYTHLNYAFAFIDPNTFEVANMQDSDTEYMKRLTALKNYNPGLQVWVSLQSNSRVLSLTRVRFPLVAGV
jgi:chitinase